MMIMKAEMEKDLKRSSLF